MHPIPSIRNCLTVSSGCPLRVARRWQFIWPRQSPSCNCFTMELVNSATFCRTWEYGGTTSFRGTRPLRYLRSMADLERSRVIAHGNYLDEEEIDFVANHRNLAVAYCPRTHAFFGHRQHPCRIIARGGVVAIGTDGRCLNPDLSVWNEMLFLSAQTPECDPAILLQMGTRNGARRPRIGGRSRVTGVGQTGEDCDYSAGRRESG